jgi:hypothetical protein
MDEALKSTILGVLAKQNDMTIATLRDDQYPQATTVSYANDGLDIYFGCWMRSQKAQNIARHDKVSLTVTAPYSDWNSIKGISLGGTAVRVTASAEIARVESLFFKKFPSVVQYAPDDRSEMAYFKIIPKVISVLDYTKSFGHTDLVTMQ